MKTSVEGDGKMLIGEIKEIIRHPVKSFRGQSVKRTIIESYGLYGDRSHAFQDASEPGKFLTATQLPPMLLYSAEFTDSEESSKIPSPKIKSPFGKIYEWGDLGLQDELESLSGKKTSPIKYSSMVPLGAIEEEHLLLTTDASLTRLEELWGEKVDHRRFRSNIHISLIDKIPYIEDTWFGKKLVLGEAELEIKRHCERCTIIAMDPTNNSLDLTLLKTIVETRNNYFGVYASVLKKGAIQTGDKIFLLDK